jgi:hypothetical protein
VLPVFVIDSSMDDAPNIFDEIGTRYTFLFFPLLILLANFIQSLSCAWRIHVQKILTWCSRLLVLEEIIRIKFKCWFSLSPCCHYDMFARYGFLIIHSISVWIYV